MTKIKKEVKEPVVKKKKAKNYLNNKDLLKQIELSHQQDKITDELANMFLLLCRRYAKMPNFINYSYNDDMQSYALLTLVKVWRSFDPKKSSNPFAYFTQTVKRAFWQYLNVEKVQRNIRDELLIENGENPSFGFQDKSEEDSTFDHNYYNMRIPVQSDEVEEESENN